MRLSLLRPVNGWRIFFGEVGIIVLGVLIALGAQQAVDRWRWQADVREFRAVVDNELGYNLGAYIDRRKKSACIGRRLDQLEQWHEGLAAGERLKLTNRIGRPTSTSLRTSAWQSRTPDVTAHLGLERRLAYASMYDIFANYQIIGDRERQAWGELLDFEGAATLEPRDMLRLRGLIERARLTSRLIEGNWKSLARQSAELGLRPWEDKDVPPSETFCDPLTWERI